MASLPPLTDTFDTYADVLACARRRWKEAWQIDPRDGCMEPPTIEFGSVAVLAAAGLALLLALSSLVTVFFTRGPVLWAQAGLMVVLGLFAFVKMRGNTAVIRARRRQSRVTTGGIVMANNALFDAAEDGSAWGVALVVSDDALAADAEAIADLAERAYAEWRAVKPEDVPEELREVVLYVCQDTPIQSRAEIPESWAGRRGLWLTSVYFDRGTLPGHVMSRRVMPFLLHPSDQAECAEPLPPAFWWREDVDDLTRAWE